MQTPAHCVSSICIAMQGARLFAGQRLGMAGLQSHTEAPGGVIDSQSGPTCHSGGVCAHAMLDKLSCYAPAFN